MSRPFTLPVVIACSAHALLMFGFKKPEVIPPSGNTVCAEPRRVCEFPLPPEEPLDCPPAAGAATAGGKAEVPPPAAPESLPSTVSFEDILMDPTRNENRHVKVPTNVVPTNIYEPGDGDGNEREFGRRDGIVFPPTALDNTPRTRVQNPPAYPFSLKASGISGEVLVEFVVDERGRVTHPRVLSSTHPDFEAATLNAVSKWRFEPGTRKMKPVSFKMVVPVKFNLND
jgi:protein TonB